MTLTSGDVLFTFVFPFCDVLHHPFILGVQAEGVCGNMAVTKGRPHDGPPSHNPFIFATLGANCRVLSRRDVEDNYVGC